jgi:TolB-like protein/DNA-binding winged helix-turn-helix (wHTH) protein/Flp pilus assembly protein TadD
VDPSSSAQQENQTLTGSAPARLFRFGSFGLDGQSGELSRHGEKVRLPEQAFQILELLLSRPGEVVTRDELRQRLWKAGTFVDFQVGLNSAVRKLREALDDSAENPQFVETLPRRGYRFIAPVEALHRGTDRRPAASVVGPASWARTKMVAAGVVIVAVVAILAVSYQSGWSLGARPAADEIRSLAVMPFDNFTGDPAQQYLSDAITDALTTHLAEIELVNVTSRASAMRFKMPHKRPPDIGRELNVDALVQGALARSGHQLRVSVQVVHAATDHHVWARSYDGELGGIITLTQRIAGDVATAIGRRLPPAAVSRRTRSVDAAAADAYKKGLVAAAPMTYEHLRTGIAYFEEAIARQRDYAEAHAALAQAQLQLLFMGPLSPRQLIPKAEAAARRAIELDGTLARPHETLGTILTHFYWKWDEGDAEFQRARQLSAPADETAGTAVIVLVRTGRRDEAIAQAERERRQDPLSFSAQMNVAVAYRAAARYDRAIAEFRRAIEMSPEQPRARFQLGVTFLFMGRHAEAIRELEAAVARVDGNPRMTAYLGYAYATAGRTAEARSLLDQLVSRARDQYVSSFGIALIHDALGEKEPALAALERAYQDRAVEFAQMFQYPPFKTIASHPRYETVMRRVGLSR